MMLRSVVLSLMILSLICEGTAAQLPCPAMQDRHTRLYIFIFNDNNKNGLLDSGERQIDGWPFLIKGPEYSKRISVHSGMSLNVPPGEYLIRQEPKPNWINTTRQEIAILIKPHEQPELYFGNYNTKVPPCEIPHINCSLTEPPQVSLTPDTLSFASYDPQELVIWVNNPPFSHIIKASVKLDVPEGWIINPSTEDTPIDYIIKYNALELDNFGNFEETEIHDYIEIKPEVGVSDDDHWLVATSKINYLYRYPNATYNLFCNTTQEIKIKLTKEKEEDGILKMLRDNSVIITVFCSIIIVIFGSGGPDRVNKIKDRLRKKR